MKTAAQQQQHFVGSCLREAGVEAVRDVGSTGVSEAVVDAFSMVFWRIVIWYHIPVYYLFSPRVIRMRRSNIFVIP